MDHTPWGELEPSDEESSEEEEEEESDEEKPDETGFFTPADRYLTCVWCPSVRPLVVRVHLHSWTRRFCRFSGLITPGGFSSVPAGMETPELIELRKKKIEEAMDG